MLRNCFFMDEPCPYPGKWCSDCQILIEAMMEAKDAVTEIKRNLCPWCYADMAVWEEVFGEKHSCWERE